MSGLPGSGSVKPDSQPPRPPCQRSSSRCGRPKPPKPRRGGAFAYAGTLGTVTGESLGPRIVPSSWRLL